jgi:hypothetical protein
VIPLRSGIAAEDTGMMGERMVMQDSLFMSFGLNSMFPPITSCARSTGSSICLI